MNKKRLALVLVISLASITAQAKESYVCGETQSIGFNPTDSGGQKQANFRTLGMTAVLDGKELSIKRNGDTVIYTCSNPWGHKPKLLQCVEVFYFVMFDIENLRFSHARIYGHVDKSPDSLFVTYGDCQKL